MPRTASAGAGSKCEPPVFHLHRNRHRKRAGEAGSRLRALGIEGPFEASLTLAGAQKKSRESAGEGLTDGGL